jgi:hypothetical protein
MHSGRGDTPQRVPGFPIRKPPDHSLAADSPGLIAGSSVLHRLLVPRHPPCALKNLAQQNYTLFHSQKQEMLASTVQFSRNGRKPDPATTSVMTGTWPARRPGPAAVPSGPNSVPTRRTPRAPPFQPPAGDRTSQENRKRDLVNSQCSTRKQWTPAGTNVPRGAWCSLERR